jgi:hypothetical protein
MPLFKVIGAELLLFRPKWPMPEDREDAVDAGAVWVSRVTWVLVLLPLSFEITEGFRDPA